MSRKERSLVGKIVYWGTIVVLLFVAAKLFDRYKVNNFNDFVRSEYKLYTSEFARDDEVKYSDMSSYKISSEEENDAMFYKTIEVTPYTPYKVTCMVKTENVKTVKEVSSGGAHIGIADTLEKSRKYYRYK